MYSRDDIRVMNGQVVAVDPDEGNHFELLFAKPDSPEQIAQLESLIGVSLPPALKALYLTTGAFKHVHYGNVGDTIRIDSVEYQLELFTRPQNKVGPYPYTLGLVGFIHAMWSGREEFVDSLDVWTEQTVNANYFVFGERYIDDNVDDYLYFDRNGLFGNFRFDQDQAAVNINRLDNLANILPEVDADLDADARRAYVLAEAASFDDDYNTFPGASLEQLLQSQFESIVDGLTEG